MNMLSTIFPMDSSARLFCSFITAFTIFILFGKQIIQFLTQRKIGQPIRDDKGFLLAELHKDKKNRPTMGGLFLVLSMLASTILWNNWQLAEVRLLLFSTLFFASVGMVDDWAKLHNKSSKGISARSRMLLQTGMAAGVIWAMHAAGLRIDRLFIPFMAEPIYFQSCAAAIFISFLQWFTLVGSANAVNLTDGLDGLASGVGFCSMLFLIVWAWCMPEMYAAEAAQEIAIYLAALAGATLGFLWYNAHPAALFMGDTGSLAIGGTLGMASILMQAELYLGLVGCIFVAEALSVIMQVISFRTTGKRVFRCAPLHHHFEFAGMPETKVVARFWIVSFVMLLIGLLAMRGVR